MRLFKRRELPAPQPSLDGVYEAVITYEAESYDDAMRSYLRLTTLLSDDDQFPGAWSGALVTANETERNRTRLEAAEKLLSEVHGRYGGWSTPSAWWERVQTWLRDDNPSGDGS